MEEGSVVTLENTQRALDMSLKAAGPEAPLWSLVYTAGYAWAFHAKELRQCATHGGSPRAAGAEDVLEMAVRMPARIRVGLGGQPGKATSTGMTFETRPQLA
jgi:hypothetical protein